MNPYIATVFGNCVRLICDCRWNVFRHKYCSDHVLPGQKEMKEQEVLQAPEHRFPVAYGDSCGKAGFPPAAHGEAVSEQIPAL